MSYQTTDPRDAFIMSTMEDLVPDDHLVSKLLKHVCFDFIRDLTKLSFFIALISFLSYCIVGSIGNCNTFIYMELSDALISSS